MRIFEEDEELCDEQQNMDNLPLSLDPSPTRGEGGYSPSPSMGKGVIVKISPNLIAASIVSIKPYLPSIQNE